MKLLAWVLAIFAPVAFALETASWPPPDDTVTRMRALQGVIVSPDSSAAQREAAREELSGLLKSPAGQARGRTPGEKKAAPRAAIEPIGPIVRPAANPPVFVPAPGVATVEVVQPPRIIIAPRTGAPAFPAARAAVDPRTGNVLHDAGNGYVDPRTGAFTPK